MNGRTQEKLENAVTEFVVAQPEEQRIRVGAGKQHIKKGD